MARSQVLIPSKRFQLSFVALVAAFCLMLTTSVGAMADTVRISDPLGVLNQSRVMSEGTKLSYPLDIYTTNTFSGTASDFVTRTIAVHLTSKRLIVIAIDTFHHYLAIVGGSSVSLTKSDYTNAGTAFKKNFSGNNFTNATIAAIQSLANALKPGSPISGFVLGLIVVVIIGLVIISAIVGFVRRLLGFGPRTTPNTGYQQPQPTSPQNRGNYGDGRDNLGSGAVGDF
jgi:hypothetical protein